MYKIFLYQVCWAKTITVTVGRMGLEPVGNMIEVSLMPLISEIVKVLLVSRAPDPGGQSKTTILI
jgi:hypothetical protein